jgi:hypothetical protein
MHGRFGAGSPRHENENRLVRTIDPAGANVALASSRMRGVAFSMAC